MSKILSCPVCESANVQETIIKYLQGGAVRKCLNCKHESKWFVHKDFISEDYLFQDQEWKSWECVDAVSRLTLEIYYRKKITQSLFDQNKIDRN